MFLYENAYSPYPHYPPYRAYQAGIPSARSISQCRSRRRALLPEMTTITGIARIPRRRHSRRLPRNSPHLKNDLSATLAHQARGVATHGVAERQPCLPAQALRWEMERVTSLIGLTTQR